VFIYVRAVQGANARKRKADRKWHAVTVLPGPKACEAVGAHMGKRYLSTEAPRLPVAGCDAQCCDCRYRHFEDRRGGPRREEDESGRARASAKTERRAGRGRRAEDATR